MQRIVAWHGFFGVKEDFALLQDDAFVLEAYDLIGHGSRKSHIRSAYTTEKQVQYWSTILQHSDILLGYSMGGRLALQYVTSPLVDDTHKPKAMILIGASPGIQDAQEKQQRQQWDLEMAEKFRHQPIEQSLLEWENLPIIETQTRIANAHRLAMQQHRLQQDRESIALSMEIFGTASMTDCWDRLSMIDIPVLVLVGEEDHKYRAIQTRMAQHIPNATCYTISNAGHCAHLENPHHTIQVIREWIASL